MKQTIKLISLLLAVLLLAGCTAPRTEPQKPGTTESTSRPETTPSETTLAPSAEPPTQASEETTEPTPEETTPESAPVHSGIREDGTFDGHTLFLGDSLTHMFLDKYLRQEGLWGDARVAARFGAFLRDFFNETVTMDEAAIAPCLFSQEFAGLTFAEAAAVMGADAHAIYIMFGTNYNHEDTAQDYIDVISYLLEVCPNATIHMQLIPYGELPCDEVNEKITAAWSYFQEEGYQRVLLIDTYTAIGDRPSDGIHQSDYGNSRWYQCLLAHARDNQLSQ